jgi:serine/threonine-protein phosphatase 2B catalytic subunit
MSGTRTHLERAIHQIQDKGPIPEIDFTQHQLEDGNTISTQERVVKDVRPFQFLSLIESC